MTTTAEAWAGAWAGTMMAATGCDFDTAFAPLLERIRPHAGGPVGSNVPEIIKGAIGDVRHESLLAAVAYLRARGELVYIDVERGHSDEDWADSLRDVIDAYERVRPPVDNPPEE